MLCNQGNVVHVRKKDGTRQTVYRCADPQSPLFTQNVALDQCRRCPRYLAAQSAREAQAAVEKVPEVPGLIQRAKTWTGAVLEWKFKGSPERPDEDVERIFRTFCAATPPCRWYDPLRQICRGCGCGVSTEGPAIFNKIKMATQHCPRALW